MNNYSANVINRIFSFQSEKIAIVDNDGNRKTSYGDFSKIVNSYAFYLKSKGINKGDRIVLSLNRSMEHMAMRIACNMIGGVFISINPKDPEEYKNQIFKDCNPTLIIEDNLLTSINIENYPIQTDYSVSDENDGYIVYTSGTTGTPKGILHSRASYEFYDFYFYEFGYKNIDFIYATSADMGFIASIMDMAPLFLGGTLHIISDETRLDILELKNYLITHNIDSTFMLPNLFESISPIPTLKKVFIGSKPSNGDFSNLEPDIYNLYGSSEMFIIAYGDAKKSNSIIDKTIGATEFYIKNENGELLSPNKEGIEGELCISTPFLMKGYLNNEKLTNETLGSKDNFSYINTGDLCISSNTQGIELTGRRDSMVKIRGNRVDLVGIEYSLLQIDNINEVAVKSFDEDDDVYINAYYSTDNNKPIDDAKLKEELKKSLKSYMIPRNFVHMESFERNAHGKIDYAKLEAVLNKLEMKNISLDGEELNILTQLFSQVLGKEINEDDDFIKCGGDSLSAMNLQLLIKNTFNLNISSNEIIECKNPKNLLKLIKNKTLLNINEIKFSYDDAYPLSESQLNIYLDLATNDLGIAYNNAFKLTFDKDFTIYQIKSALNKLIDAHPILSSHIKIIDGEPNLVFDKKPLIEEIAPEKANSKKESSNEEVKGIIPENELFKPKDITNKGLINDEEFVKPYDIYESLSHFLIGEGVIYIDFHHIISDGSSISIFANELIDILYNDEEVTFDDGFLRNYSLEKVLLKSEDFKKAEEFYNNMLVEVEEIPELIPSVGENESNVLDYELNINKNLLKTFLSTNSITLNQFFASVFGYTISRFTSSSKVLFSLVEDGRGQMDLNNSIGMFVKTLPIIINCENKKTTDFLKDSASIINSAMKYDFYPYRILAKEFELNSDILFQYSHSMINKNNIEFKNLNPNLVCDLSMNVYDKGNQFGFTIMHSSKFSNQFIDTFVGVYKQIAMGIINENELKDIIYISDEDVQFLDKFNDNITELDYVDILDGFNDSLEKYPDNILVSYEDKSYTYREGAYAIQQIANALEEFDINLKDIVCVFVERSEWYLLATLGVLTRNAIYVPLVEDFTDERIKFIISNTESKVVIVTNKTINRLERVSHSIDVDFKILNLSNIDTEGKLDRLNFVRGIYLNPVCIIYTSGTTGTPKGVVLMRVNISALADFYVNKFNLTVEDNCALFASYNFDATLVALFPILLKGASLYIVPEDIRLNLTKLNNFFIENNVTQTLITTQLAKMFVKEIEETSLKYLLTGGEKLGEIEPPKNYELIDCYGPTECTTFNCQINVKDKIDPSSVGVVNNNTISYILDDEYRRVPLGASGKLYLSSFQLSLEYFKLEEITEKASIKNPYLNYRYFEWLYNTGDIARYLPDGSIAIVGRNDGQVKIRGNRIELSEVESIIRKLDFIEDVTVQVYEDNGNKGIMAYVVTNQDFNSIELNDIVSEFITETHPQYMVPDFVKQLDTIPLNVNGKVDKRALPKIDLSNLIVDYVPPSNEEERLLVSAFEELFKLDKVSVNDDFLRLGGDSLSAISLLSKLDTVSLSAADILKLRTPKVIANQIRSTKNLNIDLDKYSLETGCPLSESQLNVYLDITSNNKKDSYLIPLVIDFEDNYSAKEIIFGLNEMILNHPILSGYVDDVDNTPYLKVGKEISLKVIKNEDKELINSIVNDPFDLEESLTRFLIVEENNSVKLYATFHHLIFDGMSSSVFENHLFALLRGKTLDEDISFLKVSAFNQQIQDTYEFDEAKEYYDQVLADFEEVTPLLEDVGDNFNNSGEIKLNVDKKHIKNLLENNNFSANALFTSVFAYTLSRFTGGEKVFFNITENGRDRFNNLYSIGMFVNTLPLIVDCSNKEVIDFVKEVGDTIYNTLKYNFYPFRLLAKDYNIDSSIIFQYFPKDEEDSDLSFYSNNLGTDLITDKDDLISDLTFNMVENEDSYSLNFIHSAKYSSETIDRIINTYESVLNGFINKNNLSDIEFITEEDIDFLDKFNENSANLEYDDILGGFSDSLVKYPDNTLVSYEDKSYTYSEGGFIAQQIANALKNLNVQEGDNVAIFVERSEWYLLASLGVLAINGCYVPLVEDFPDERIKYIIKDSGAKTVIVSNGTLERFNEVSKEFNNINVLNVSTLNTEGKLNTFDYIKGTSQDSKSYKYPACILYTSGTTGIPKGVVIMRENITALADFYDKEFNFTSEDKYGLFASYNFDASLIALYVILLKGGSLDIVPEDIRLNIKELNNHFMKCNITHTMLTTQLGKIFTNEIKETSIKYLITGGEKLGEIENPTQFNLIDGYGPTEATAFIAHSNVGDKIDSSSVGFLNDNTISFILDKEGRRLPLGCVGELYISSKQLSKEYLNLEKETEKAFIKNTISNVKEFNRLYRTGDVARYLPDGSIAIIGRDDGQVKIRGNRIELTEVENIIRELSFVEDVTVQVIEVNGVNNLVAYVVCDKTFDSTNLKDDVSTFVQNNKPKYMIPAFVIELDSIPLNVNGKVDKHKLPEPNLDELKIKYVAPSNKVEEDIVQSFEETLNISHIGVNDNFFNIGGSSLTVVKLLINLKNKGYDLAYEDIFNKGTPYKISQGLTSSNESYFNDKIVDYDYREINEILKENTFENFNNGDCEDLGNILLTGATGFLGVHTLYEFINNEEGIAYCMVRKSNNQSVEDKLKQILHSYFNEDFAYLFGSRIIPLEGDITNHDDFDKFENYPINTLINCAANVKHFSESDDILDVNYYGVINALDFATKIDCKFIHVSTASIAGEKLISQSDMVLDENSLYLGQIINNKYIESKFLAERAILERVTKGLKGKIIRVGNLMARDTDYTFQSNADTNAFLNYIKSFTIIKSISNELEFAMELSPINFVAKTILELAKTPSKCCIFHSYNPIPTSSKTIIDTLNFLDFGISIDNPKEFDKKLQDILEDQSNYDKLWGYFHYQSFTTENTMPNGFVNDYTIKVLNNLGITWPLIEKLYLFNFFYSLKELGFFE